MILFNGQSWNLSYELWDRSDQIPYNLSRAGWWNLCQNIPNKEFWAWEAKSSSRQPEQITRCKSGELIKSKYLTWLWLDREIVVGVGGGDWDRGTSHSSHTTKRQWSQPLKDVDWWLRKWSDKIWPYTPDTNDKSCRSDLLLLSTVSQQDMLSD